MEQPFTLYIRLSCGSLLEQQCSDIPSALHAWTNYGCPPHAEITDNLGGRMPVHPEHALP